jgi:EAL domain-containing protein (putative c-di-GMP-specific phosphodiesterase class I)
VVTLPSARAIGVEALARWTDPVLGVVPPDVFIPVAEATGLIHPLGAQVLFAACHTAAGWRHDDAHAPRVAVNVSPLQLATPAFVDQVATALDESGLDPQRLVLEITETLLVRDAESGATKLNGLRDLGVRLALDDFGTGYSSLSYLRTLPLDVLKIAKQFVDGIAVDEADTAFVRLIIELAGTIGLTVVAEGIETAQQETVLAQLGCDRGQGFFYARPLSDEAHWLAETQRRFSRRSGQNADQSSKIR